MRASWVRLAVLGGVVIVAGVLVAWLLELPLGRQIRRLAEASTRLGQGDLASRAPDEGPEELRVLAASFNQMAADLEHSIEAQREFVANASHQLRTPLTGLRLRLEAISSEGGPSAEQAVKAEAELDRLTALVDDLLALARATASDSTAGPVDLAAVAGEAANRWRDAATASGKRLELRARGEPRVWAKREDLAQVLDNLIDNALRYSSADAEVRVETSMRDGQAFLRSLTPGPGSRRRIGLACSSVSTAEPTDGEPAVAPVSVSPSSRSSCGARAARSGSWTGRAPGWKRCFHRDLSNPNPRLVEPWKGGC